MIKDALTVIYLNILNLLCKIKKTTLNKFLFTKINSHNAFCKNAEKHPSSNKIWNLNVLDISWNLKIKFKFTFKC